MNVTERVRGWMGKNGVVAPGLDELVPSFARRGRRLLQEGHGIPTTWWDGTALEQNYMTLHLLQAKLRRKDLSSKEREQSQARVHELRNLIVRLGGLPGRGYHS
jgi:hypothetical protein